MLNEANSDTYEVYSPVQNLSWLPAFGCKKLHVGYKEIGDIPFGIVVDYSIFMLQGSRTSK